MAAVYPLPFLIESGGANYAFVELHNLDVKVGEALCVVLQAQAWFIEALKIDARSDFRCGPSEQQVAQFLCRGDEYQSIKMREWLEWLDGHGGDAGTGPEFEAQFKIDDIDDSVRNPNLPQWLFLIFEEGAPWATEDILQAPGFRGIFYVWNVRTVLWPEPPKGVWLTSPNPMLAASADDLEWWLDMFADAMHSMLSYEFPLANDDRVLWLEAVQFPTERLWLAWRSGTPSDFRKALKQRLIAHGLALPDPVYVIEERFVRSKPPPLDPGWMVATRRMRQYPFG